MFLPDLKVDSGVLQSSLNKLSECANELLTIKNGIETVIDVLRDDWTTDAGVQYVKLLDDILLPNLQKYADLVDHQSKNLQDAMDKYAYVFEAADTLAAAEY